MEFLRNASFFPVFTAHVRGRKHPLRFSRSSQTRLTFQRRRGLTTTISYKEADISLIATSNPQALRIEISRVDHSGANWQANALEQELEHVTESVRARLEASITLLREPGLDFHHLVSKLRDFLQPLISHL